MYKKGHVLKSKLRTSASPLFVMVCDDGTVGGDLDQTTSQFRAVVLFDAAEEYEAGMVDSGFNKGRWIQSNLSEAGRAVII